MIFKETALKGAYLIEVEPFQDERGFFARTWCSQEFAEQGLNPNLVQCNISYNLTRGTVRGMHYQVYPFEEAKLIRCTKGSIYDVIVDLRPLSSTYKHWIGVELSAENRVMLYVPEGFAHGFQTLEDNTEVFYQMSQYYSEEAAAGFNWNDPDIGIKWPLTISAISAKDSSYTGFQ